MSQYTVLTLGFGSFTTQYLTELLGFSSGSSPTPPPPPTPTTTVGGNPSGRGIYTGKWVDKSLQPVPDKQLSRREKRILRQQQQPQVETKKVQLTEEQIRERVKAGLPRPPTIQTIATAQAVAKEMLAMEAMKGLQAAAAKEGMMALEAQQRAQAQMKIIAARKMKDEDEIAMLFLMDDL